jgi:hypothetical protein
MHTRSFTAGASLAAILCLGSSLVLSQPQKGDAKPATEQPKDAKPAMPAGAPDAAAMMEEWMKLSSPSDGHKRLDALVGEWKTTQKMWMEGPQGPSVETQGTSTSKWILGGRFIHQEDSNIMKFPGPDGKMSELPFSGVGMTGYDNYRNIYNGVWVDSMGTVMLTFKGVASQDGKTITMYGEMDEPSLHMVGRAVKYVTIIESNDKHIFQLFDLAAGDNFKVVEVTYERKK